MFSQVSSIHPSFVGIAQAPVAFGMPMVIEHVRGGDRAMDVYTRLLKDRIIVLGTPIDDGVANAICAILLFLDSEDPDKDISMYINSPGGVVTAGLAIYDTMQNLRAPVSTLCMGQAASMGAVLLCAGRKGKRYVLPNSTVMIHQPLGGARGQATDIEIQAQEIKRLKTTLTGIVSKHTGKDYDTVYKDMERDNYLDAKTAVAYGLADEVQGPRPAV